MWNSPHEVITENVPGPDPGLGFYKSILDSSQRFFQLGRDTGLGSPWCLRAPFESPSARAREPRWKWGSPLRQSQPSPLISRPSAGDSQTGQGGGLGEEVTGIGKVAQKALRSNSGLLMVLLVRWIYFENTTVLWGHRCVQVKCVCLKWKQRNRRLKRIFFNLYRKKRQWYGINLNLIRREKNFIKTYKTLSAFEMTRGVASAHFLHALSHCLCAIHMGGFHYINISALMYTTC